MNFDNTDTGILSRNDDKTEDRQPDFKGSCNVAGTEMWISAWIREAGPQAKNPGRKFFSLRFQPKEAAKAEGARIAPEDLPF